MQLSPAEIEAALRQFSGSMFYHRHQPGLLLTDGAHFLADHAGCYWLYDIVWSVLPRLPEDHFALVKLTVNLAEKAGVVVIEDGNGHTHWLHTLPRHPLLDMILLACQGLLVAP